MADLPWKKPAQRHIWGFAKVSAKNIRHTIRHVPDRNGTFGIGVSGTGFLGMRNSERGTLTEVERSKKSKTRNVAEMRDGDCGSKGDLLAWRVKVNHPS